MYVMAEDLPRRPSEAEQLAADYPYAEIYREILDDGRHGDWIADLRVRFRAATPAGLRALLVQIDKLS